MTKTVLNKFTDRPYFTIFALRQEGEGMPLQDLYNYISRWVKSGELIRLKNGLFTTREFRLKTSGDFTYPELIANVLCQPSYISSFYVLNKYSMLSESPVIISSTTLKTPRIFQNEIGGYSYKNINKRLYTGFVEQYGTAGSVILIATKAKALFDYLWERLGNLAPEDPNMVEELRINWEQMEEKDWVEFKKYCFLANKKMQKMFPEISKYDKLYFRS